MTAAAKDKAAKDSTAAAIEILKTLPECEVSQRTKKASKYRTHQQLQIQMEITRS